MNILILGLNYSPELTSIGPYTTGLAEHLSAAGHKVKVVTGFPTAPQWEVWKGYKGRRFMREVLNGIPVLRTYLYVPKNPRKASRRILFDSSFALSALAGILSRPRPDLVVVISPPLQLAVTGRLIAALGRARVFLHIQDLVPDAAVAVGTLGSGSTLVKLGRKLERWAYKGSAGISVICEGMRRNLLEKGVPAEKVVVLPNFIDPDLIRPIPENNDFRSRFGIAPGDFLVVYTGSVAGKQGLQTFVEAASAFENGGNTTCAIFGDGAYLPELKQMAEKLSLRRFKFFPIQPREALAPMMSAADVLIITQRKAITDMVFPGKLLYYMAAGTAVLASANPDSETGRFIREHRVGLITPPEDPQALAEAIRWLKSNPEQRTEFGRNGRRMVETQFDRSIVLKNFTARLELCGASR